MGACSFDLKINATNLEQFKSQFHHLAEEDRYENGHDAYSGTIGQKSGWKMVSSTPVSESRLSELKKQYEGDKWGHAMACPVAKTKSIGKVIVLTKTVEVLEDGYWAKDEAFRIVKTGLPSNHQIVGNHSIEKVSEPVYKVELDENSKENEGWRVRTIRSLHPQIFKTQAEANKVAKEVALTGRAEVFKQGPQYKRVLKTKARYKVTLQYQLTETTNEISHYEVWGWAAE